MAFLNFDIGVPSFRVGDELKSSFSTALANDLAREGARRSVLLSE